MSGQTYTTLNVTRPREHVVRVEMNRPEKRNAMNRAFWSELKTVFQELNTDSDCRVVVLTGAGKIFSAGIDLMDFSQMLMLGFDSKDPGRIGFALRQMITEFQEPFMAIEKCTKPVIVAVHGACLGAGIDMISACDIRYCTQDTNFQIKEIELGVTSDIGTLQWFPKIVGNESLARELILTARPFGADVAKQIGFGVYISRTCFRDGDITCMTVTAGLDLMDFGQSIMASFDSEDVGRKAFKIRGLVQDFQETFTSIEKCTKPVIAAIHNACVGGGVDMTSACDIRYCSQDAWFQIKEVDIGLAADVGTLQRFPKVIGNDSTARELAYTARPFYAEEAKQIGFVSRILDSKESCIEAALDTASLIASKSPVAVQGTKVSMVYSKDHSVAEGLAHVAMWNQAMLQSEDLTKAAQAMMEKKQPTFSKL